MFIYIYTSYMYFIYVDKRYVSNNIDLIIKVHSNLSVYLANQIKIII